MACVSTNDCRCILGVAVFIYYKQLSHFQYTQTDMARNYNFTICNDNHSLHNKMQFSDLIYPEDSLLWSVKLQIVLLYFFFRTLWDWVYWRTLKQFFSHVQFTQTFSPGVPCDEIFNTTFPHGRFFCALTWILIDFTDNTLALFCPEN